MNLVILNKYNMDKLGREIIVDLWIVKDENLDFICERRNDWLIFYNKEKNQYIRIWKKEDLKKEFEKHKLFLNYNFRVANIISSFEKDDFFLYVEDNVWVDVIWKEILEKQISYEKWFENIYNLAKWYFESQKNTINKNLDTKEIIKSNELELFRKECLEWKFFDNKLIDVLFNKIITELEKSEFFELTHWDFNTRNIFTNWIIDVEDSYNWTVWYDLISLISHNYWFPLDWNWRTIIFSYKTTDIEKLISLYKNISWMNLDDNFNLSFILRSVWACVWMDDLPDEQEYRYNRFKKYAEKYLNWEDLLEVFLGEVDDVNKILESK